MLIDVRFLKNISTLFAPKIHEGQVFTAYMDVDDNSFSIKCDNVLGNSATIDAEKMRTLISEVESVAQTADFVLQKCNDMITSLNAISSFITDVETLSGDGNAKAEFEFSYLADDVSSLAAEVNDVANKKASAEPDNITYNFYA